MKQPLVTIAISCYNHEKYVKQSLFSALRQTYGDIQILVFDDGSKDQGSAIIESIQKDHQFFFRKQDNQGLSRTLNDALTMAKGKYFAPFGSDDIMMLDKVEKQVAFMEANPHLAACGGNILRIDESGIIATKQKINPSTTQDFHHLFLGKGPGLPAPTMFFRTKELRSIDGFHPEIPLEDLYVQLRLTRDGGQIGLLNDILAYYRIHPTNTYKNLSYMLNNVLKTYSFFCEQSDYEEAKYKFLNSMLLRSAKSNTSLAREILPMIPLTRYSWKTFRALPYLLRIKN